MAVGNRAAAEAKELAYRPGIVEIMRLSAETTQ